MNIKTIKDSNITKTIDLGKYYRYDSLIMKKANDYSLKLDGTGHTVKVIGKPENINDFVQFINEYHKANAKIIDAKSFMVKYMDRTYKVKASDHQEAANKVIKKLKDASTLTEKEYYQVLDKIPRFENVEIHFNAPRFGGGLEARVNWSAVGSVDTDKAKKFIVDLQKAVKIVEDLNKKYGGYKVTYSDCKSVLKDGAEENDKEFLKNAIEEMERYVSNWSFMTASEKRNVGMDRNQLRNKIEEYRRKLATLK